MLQMKSIAYLDVDLSGSMPRVFCVQFSFPSLSVKNIEFYEANTKDFSSDEDTSGFGWLLQHVSRWKEIDPSMCVLFPSSLCIFKWSLFFLCYARKVRGEEIVSMCGPLSDAYYLTPVSDHILMFHPSRKSISDEDIRNNPIPAHLSESLPLRDKWDWQSALTACFLFSKGIYNIEQEKSGRDIIVF